MNLNYRPIKENEFSFLNEMLYEALFVPPGQPKFPKSILDHPDIQQYVACWNQQAGDIATVALDGEELVGAIWGRLFEVNQQGYGFIDESTPEISMAIEGTYRNRGIGTSLLTRIEQAYSKIGVDQLSLSVDKRNPAQNLYARCGYEIYKNQETAFTMVKQIGKYLKSS